MNRVMLAYRQGFADAARARATGGMMRYPHRPLRQVPGLKLNLGCGRCPLEGFVNVDLAGGPSILVHDLRTGWPWSDNTVDYILASHVFEHLPDKIFTMNEAWRVLKPGAYLEIALPTTDGPGAWQDPTHVSFWNRRSFLYYEEGSPYREGLARAYGIDARFRVCGERIDDTADGPILEIVLQAIKP